MFRMRTLFAIEPDVLNASGRPMNRQAPRALIGHTAENTRPSSVLKDRRQAVFPLIPHLVEIARRLPKSHIRRTPPLPVELPKSHSRERSVT
jgi:hypothetical protein